MLSTKHRSILRHIWVLDSYSKYSSAIEMPLSMDMREREMKTRPFLKKMRLGQKRR
jgi:hypothetical protein